MSRKSRKRLERQKQKNLQKPPRKRFRKPMAPPDRVEEPKRGGKYNRQARKKEAQTELEAYNRPNEVL